MLSAVQKIRRRSLDDCYDQLPSHIKSKVVLSSRFQSLLSFPEINNSSVSVASLGADHPVYKTCLDVGLNWFSPSIKRDISGESRQRLAQLFGEHRLRMARNFSECKYPHNTEETVDELTVSNVLTQGELCLETLYLAKSGGRLSREQKVLCDVAVRTISTDSKGG